VFCIKVHVNCRGKVSGICRRFIIGLHLYRDRNKIIAYVFCRLFIWTAIRRVVLKSKNHELLVLKFLNLITVSIIGSYNDVFESCDLPLRPWLASGKLWQGCHSAHTKSPELCQSTSPETYHRNLRELPKWNKRLAVTCLTIGHQSDRIAVAVTLHVHIKCCPCDHYLPSVVTVTTAHQQDIGMLTNFVFSTSISA